MKRYISHSFVLFCLTVLCLVAETPVTLAQAPLQAGGQLTLRLAREDRSGGQRTPIVAHLMMATGKPIAGVRVLFFVDGIRDGEARTDGNGIASWRIRRVLRPGSYTVSSLFEGLPGLQPMRATMSLLINHPRLELTIEHPDADGSKHPIVVAHLTTVQGKPLGDARLSFLVSGRPNGEARTDVDGKARWRIQGDLAAGSYPVTVIFDGLPALLPVQTTIPLLITASTLEVSAITSVTNTAESDTGQATQVVTTTPSISSTFTVGNSVTLLGIVRRPTGEPVPNAPVTFLLDGTRIGLSRTDASGKAIWRLGRSLSAGTYQIDAAFDGVPGVRASRSRLQLEIHPALIQLQTVPKFAGARFSLDDRVFVSGTDGIAQIEVEKAGTYHLKVLSAESSQSGVRAEFARWDDEVYVPERDLKIPLEGPLQVGYNMSYLITPKWVDLDGRQVESKRVTSVKISLVSTQGTYPSFEKERAQWLQGGRIARVEKGLEEREIWYAIDNVIVDGSNVVNQSQQRFSPQYQRDWTIRLMFYSVRVNARDALFGFPIGSGMHLEYPDKHAQFVSFGPNADVTIKSLPRGDYRIRVESRGVSPIRPIALSRDQDIDLSVISPLDLAVISFLLASVAVALFWIGNPWIIQLLHILLPLSRGKVIDTPSRALVGVQDGFQDRQLTVAKGRADVASAWYSTVKSPERRGRLIIAALSFAIILILAGWIGYELQQTLVDPSRVALASTNWPNHLFS